MKYGSNDNNKGKENQFTMIVTLMFICDTMITRKKNITMLIRILHVTLRAQTIRSNDDLSVQ